MLKVLKQGKAFGGGGESLAKSGICFEALAECSARAEGAEVLQGRKHTFVDQVERIGYPSVTVVRVMNS